MVVVATASPYGRIVLWDAKNGRADSSRADHGAPVVQIQFSPVATSGIRVSGWIVQLWNASTGVEVAVLTTDGNLSESLCSARMASLS